MSTRVKFVVTLLTLISTSAAAQHGGGGPPLRTVPPEAKQFSFLLGQFDLDVQPPKTLAMRIHGSPKLVGTWKGWRALDGFGIEDELRITDESGNAMTTAHAVRYYDATQKRWINSSIEVYRGTFSTSSAEWGNNAMTVMGHGSDSQGKSYASRSRYFDITPQSFRFVQERSYDEGKTWEETLAIDAKRVAATVSR